MLTLSVRGKRVVGYVQGSPGGASCTCDFDVNSVIAQNSGSKWLMSAVGSYSAVVPPCIIAARNVAFKTQTMTPL